MDKDTQIIKYKSGKKKFESQIHSFQEKKF